MGPKTQKAIEDYYAQKKENQWPGIPYANNQEQLSAAEWASQMFPWYTPQEAPETEE